MTEALDKLIAQQKAIEEKIEALKLKEKEPVIADIKEKIAQFGITAKELGFTGKSIKVTKAKSTAEPLYQNEEGKTWAGKGKPPLWIAGEDGKASEKLKKKYAINK